jgi:hypothetical protein
MPYSVDYLFSSVADTEQFRPGNLELLYSLLPVVEPDPYGSALICHFGQLDPDGSSLRGQEASIVPSRTFAEAEG